MHFYASMIFLSVYPQPSQKLLPNQNTDDDDGNAMGWDLPKKTIIAKRNVNDVKKNNEIVFWSAFIS